MNGWVDERRSMDQEDKANEAKGALMCLHELIAFHDPCSGINPEKLSYLLKAVMYVTFDAIPDGTCKHPRAVNDRDAE